MGRARPYQLPALLALSALSVLMAGDRVGACSCIGDVPACARIGGSAPADAVFIGEVTSLAADAGRVRARLRVTEPFLGTSAGDVDIFTGPNDGVSCAYFQFNRGERYLVFARRDDDGRLSTGNICTGTRQASTVPESDLVYLRGRLQEAAPMATIEGPVRFDPGLPVRDTPYPGARIVAESGGRRFEATSGPDGWYRIPVPTGTYTLSASVESGLYAPTPRTVYLDDARGCALNPLMVRIDGHIAGRLLDAQGSPIAGMTVDATTTRPRLGTFVAPASRAVTNAAGEYDIGQLPPDEYLVGIELWRMSDATGRWIMLPGTLDQAAARPVALDTSQRVRVPDFMLPASIETVAISGRVRDASGRPLGGIRVVLFTEAMGGRSGAEPVETNAAGEFRLSTLAGRGHRLIATREVARGQFERGEVAFDALPGLAPLEIVIDGR